ncbi:MAG: hypothetical protein HYV28_08780 [Ignavibacteriales bacterium]|nr:hypothetical protein [Ignavibacteriales bacterium]
MLKKLLPVSCLLLIWLLASCTFSPRVTKHIAAPSDSVLGSLKFDITEYEKKYPAQPGVFLDASAIFEHSATKQMGDITNWKYHTISYLKYIVLDPDDKDASLVSLHIGPDDVLNNIYVVTKSPSGKIQRFEKKHFSESSDNNGNRILKLNIPGTEKGTYVDQGFDRTFHVSRKLPLMEYDLNVLKNNPAENVQISFLFPDWWNIQSKNVSKTVQAPLNRELNEQNHKQSFTFKGTMFPERKLEPFAPYYREISPYIQLRVVGLELTPSFYDFTTWPNLSSQFKKYVMDKDGFFSTAVGIKTRELTNNEMPPPYENEEHSFISPTKHQNNQ